MSKLKPIGSEKLQGSAKLDRILEIAMYKEVEKSNINESSSNEFGITLPDGKQYFIVKEKSGYIIKKGLTESTLDYIEPMKNRSYYRSYSQALKKLNLITKELNEIYSNHEGLSLFGEQKKYTLKTPRPNVPEPSMDEPLAEPPAVPNPELPPSPLSGGDEMPDMEDMDGQMPEMGDEMPDMNDEMPDMDDDMPDIDNERKQDKGDEQVTFKTIQKLTGRLTQKIRTIENEKGLTSEEIKYVLNMVISSIDLNNLDGDDRDDIVSKLDSGDEMDDMGDEMPDMEGMDDEMPDIEGMDDEMPNMDDEMPDMEGMGNEMPEMPEMQPRMNNRRSSNMGSQNRGETYTPRKRFEESKVDSVLSKYFEVSPNEQKLNEIKKSDQQLRLNENLNNAKRFSVSKTQLESVKKFLNENRAFNIVGRTNLDNVVLENKNKKSIRINKNGNIL